MVPERSLRELHEAVSRACSIIHRAAGMQEARLAAEEFIGEPLEACTEQDLVSKAVEQLLLLAMELDDEHEGVIALRSGWCEL